MAIAGWGGGGNGESQGQLHLESEDWAGLAGRDVAAPCAGSWGAALEKCGCLSHQAFPGPPAPIAQPCGFPSALLEIPASGGCVQRASRGCGHRGGGCALCWRISKVGLEEAGEAAVYLGLVSGWDRGGDFVWDSGGRWSRPGLCQEVGMPCLETRVLGLGQKPKRLCMERLVLMASVW